MISPFHDAHILRLKEEKRQLLHVLKTHNESELRAYSLKTVTEKQVAREMLNMMAFGCSVHENSEQATKRLSKSAEKLFNRLTKLQKTRENLNDYDM